MALIKGRQESPSRTIDGGFGSVWAAAQTTDISDRVPTPPGSATTPAQRRMWSSRVP